MSRKVLILGAGRSSTSLIHRLLQKSDDLDLIVQLVDRDPGLCERKINGNPRGVALQFDALNKDERRKYIQNADLVISMLPARFHPEVIADCVELKRDILTPSYESDEVRAMKSKIEEAGIAVVNEMGLDPGIDHLSAMQIIDRIRDNGGQMLRFESFTGGLIAPESDDNPWNYKFTWNPRNVVLAGQGGTARFLQEGKFKYIPYHRLFERVKPISIPGYGDFEGYSNRDSLGYRSVYNLEEIPTIYRGTIRRKGFSEAWNVLVQLGMTDDTFQVDNTEDLTWRQFTNLFLSYHETDPVEEKLQHYLNVSPVVMDKLKWLGLFENTPLGMTSGTPAQILQKRLESRWTLKDGDKDMIVMWHRFSYEVEGKEQEIHAHMVVIGDDEDHTAMAKTVGWPLSICAELMLSGKLKIKGLVLPINPALYNPVMEELERSGVKFTETRVI